MKPDQLKSGDCLLVTATEWIGQAIADVEGSKWVHAAMVVEDLQSGNFWVYEMTWPRLRRTELGQWVDANNCSVVPLKAQLDLAKKTQLFQWWTERLGMWYDLGELLGLAPLVMAHRLCTWIGVKTPSVLLHPIATDGVCSVNVAWAWQTIGLPVTEPTAMTPADIPGQPFVGPVESVVT